MNGRRRRLGLAAVAGWTVAVVLAGSVAWRAVSVVDTDSSTAGVLDQSDVSAELVAARAAATPRPTAGVATPTPAPTPLPTQSAEPTSEPEPTPDPEVVRSWSVTGGTVAASCRGTAIALLYATPLDGWSVEVKNGGPERLEVELESGELEVTVSARCVAGTPEHQVSEHTSGGEEPSREGDED